MEQSLQKFDLNDSLSKSVAIIDYRNPQNPQNNIILTCEHASHE